MDSGVEKYLPHDDLIDLVRVYAPAISEKGVCEGTTSMWLQAVCTAQKEEENFYKRFDLISKYVLYYKHKTGMIKLTKEIDKIYETQKNLKIRKALSEEERDKIEVRAYAESVSIHQDANALKLFDKYFYQGDKAALYPFTTSARLEKQPDLKLHMDMIGVVAANAGELTGYLEKIKAIIQKENQLHPEERGGFLLSSDDHTVGLKFDVPSGKWHYFDINELSGKTEYYFSLDSAELTPQIFSGFEDDENTIFTLRYVSSRRNQNLGILMP